MSSQANSSVQINFESSQSELFDNSTISKSPLNSREKMAFLKIIQDRWYISYQHSQIIKCYETNFTNYNLDILSGSMHHVLASSLIKPNVLICSSFAVHQIIDFKCSFFINIKITSTNLSQMGSFYSQTSLTTKFIVLASLTKFI